MIRKINEYYDNIKEPWRLIIMIVVLLPFVMLCATKSTTLQLMGCWWAATIIFLRVYPRLWKK